MRQAVKDEEQQFLFAMRVGRDDQLAIDERPWRTRAHILNGREVQIVDVIVLVFAVNLESVSMVDGAIK